LAALKLKPDIQGKDYVFNGFFATPASAVVEVFSRVMGFRVLGSLPVAWVVARTRTSVEVL
jgi:hypothetical protein